MESNEARPSQTIAPADGRHVTGADLELVMTCMDINEQGLVDLEPQVEALATAVEEQLAFMRALRRASKHGSNVQAILDRLGGPDGLAEAEYALTDLKAALDHYPYFLECHGIYMETLELVADAIGSGGTVRQMGEGGVIVVLDDGEADD